MAVTVRPQPDTTAPPIDANPRLAWHPDAVADTVFPEPGRRDLAYAADAVDEFQSRVTNELRWLHDIIRDLQVRLTELESGHAGETLAQARAEAAEIVRQARIDAARTINNANEKARMLMGETVDRIAAAERTIAPDAPPETMPPLRADDIPGSLRARKDFALAQVRQVRNDAMNVASAAAETLAELAAVNTNSSTPPPPAPPARPVIDVTEPEPAPEPPFEQTEQLTNHSDHDVTVHWGDGSAVVRPGMTFHILPSMVSEELRAELAGHPSAERRIPTPGEPMARVLFDSPTKGVRSGDVIPEADVPTGIQYERLPYGYGQGPVTDPADDGRLDQYLLDRAEHDAHAESERDVDPEPYDRDVADVGEIDDVYATDDGAITGVDDPD